MSPMSPNRVRILFGTTIVTVVYLVGRLFGQHQDILSEDLTKVLALMVAIGWITFGIFTVKDHIDKRLDRLEQGILDYGDQRATDAHLEANRVNAASNGHKPVTAEHLRQVR